MRRMLDKGMLCYQLRTVTEWETCRLGLPTSPARRYPERDTAASGGADRVEIHPCIVWQTVELDGRVRAHTRCCLVSIAARERGIRSHHAGRSAAGRSVRCAVRLARCGPTP